MDIRHLRYFESVVRNEQITKAAEELHISQPSLSNAIKSIEHQLGFKLFKRSSKKLALTEPGVIFYKHACTVLNQFDNIFKEMEAVRDVGRGKINIGMIESSRYWISQIILPFKQAYPDVNLSIKELGPEEIAKALKNFDIHIGITSSMYEYDRLQYTSIFNERLVLIIPENHPFKHLKSVDISELKNETFIHSFPGFQIRQEVMNAFHAAGYVPPVVYEAERLETACCLVEMGLGISVVPEKYITFSPSKKLKHLSLKNLKLKRTVYIAYHRERYLPTTVYDFMSLIKNFWVNLSM